MSENLNLYTPYMNEPDDSRQPQQPSVAVIGNPGTGKSTILNGLVNASVFPSGMSFGTGMTLHLQSHVVDDVTFFDTPGLDDIDTRAKAAAEINKLLQIPQDLRIIFLITDIKGRLRAEDAVTIALVLDALQGQGQEGINSSSLNDRFAVVVNQASVPFVEKLTNDAQTRSMIHRKITGKRYTKYWHYIPFDASFEAKDNGILHNSQLTNLIRNMPVTRRACDPVRDLDVTSFDEKLQEALKEFALQESKLVASVQRASALREKAEEANQAVRRELEQELYKGEIHTSEAAKMNTGQITGHKRLEKMKTVLAAETTPLKTGLTSRREGQSVSDKSFQIVCNPVAPCNSVNDNDVQRIYQGHVQEHVVRHDTNITSIPATDKVISKPCHEIKPIKNMDMH